MSKKTSILENLPNMDKSKATKLVIYGLALAIIGISVFIVSVSVAQYAGNWQTIANQENQITFWDGLIGYNEYQERAAEISRTYNYMLFQRMIFATIGRIVVNIGLAVMLIGLFAFALNDNVEEKTRKIFLILASVLLVLMVFTLFFGGINVDIFI